MLKLWKVTENEIKVKNENSHFLKRDKNYFKGQNSKKDFRIEKWKSMKINENQWKAMKINENQ